MDCMSWTRSVPSRNSMPVMVRRCFTIKAGYAEAAKLAKEAVARNVTVRQLVMEKGLLKGKDLEAVLDLLAMTELGVPGERK